MIWPLALDRAPMALLVHEAYALGQQIAQPIDQDLVVDSVLDQRALLDQAALPREPYALVARADGGHFVQHAGGSQHVRVTMIDLLAAELGSVRMCRVNQDHVMPARASIWRRDCRRRRLR